VSARSVTALAAGAALGGFLFGFDTSTLNAAIVGIRSTMQLTSASVGFVAAVALIGCVVGAWFAGSIAARYGRNRVMLIAGTLIILGSLGAALSRALVFLGISRVLTGLGIGAASAVVPGYIVEIAPPQSRGRLGTFWQFALVIGQFVGLLTGYLFTQWAGSEAGLLPWGGEAWRWMFITVAIPAATWLIIVRRLPQSSNDTQRLASGNDVRELAALRGPRLGLKPIVWTGILLAAFQQLVGISAVKTYSNTIWQAVGFSTASSFTISMSTVLVSIASTVVALAIMDRVGRRTLLTTGAAAMVVALVVLAFCFATATGSSAELHLTHRAGIGALVAINIFAVAFGVTWGPVVWVMLNELFDSNLRTTAVAVCTAVNWVTNWLVVRLFPLLADSGLEVAYGLFTVFAVLAFLFAWKVLPETRDRPLG